MSQDLLSVNVTIPYGTAVGTVVSPALAIPGTANGGGITLVNAYYSANRAIGAGTSPAIQLITMTSAGVVIATVGANGSAALTAGTPIAGTISTQWIAGTVGFLGVKFGHEVCGLPDAALTACINYFHGRGSS